jgi:hypothetical protein
MMGGPAAYDGSDRTCGEVVSWGGSVLRQSLSDWPSPPALYFPGLFWTPL